MGAGATADLPKQGGWVDEKHGSANVTAARPRPGRRLPPFRRGHVGRHYGGRGGWPLRL